MKIMVLLPGTAIMHESAADVDRADRVRQAAAGMDPSLRDFAMYVPVGKAVAKLTEWQTQGATIEYLSAHRERRDVAKDMVVLDRFFFPEGMVRFRGKHQRYAGVVREAAPDILIENDRESMGPRAAAEVIAPSLRGPFRRRIGSIVVPEFGGIDDLPSLLPALADVAGVKERRSHPVLGMVLRIASLAALAGVSWFNLAGDWTNSSLLERVLSIALVVPAFIFGFRNDPYLRRYVYLCAGVVTAVVVSGIALLRDAPAGWDQWQRMLTATIAGFLSIAVATSVLSHFLFLIKLGDERAENLRRAGADMEIHRTLIRVLAGAYGIPIGVATAVLVGGAAGGWTGAIAGVAAGIATGALAWSAGYAGGWGLPGEPNGLYAAAARAPGDVASIGLGVISTVIATSSQVSGLLLDQTIQLVFAPLVAIVVTQLGLLASFALFRRAGTVVMGLLALVGAAIGVALGGLSAQLMGVGASEAMLSNARSLAIVAAGAALVAVAIQRLGSTIGFAGAAALAVLQGSSWWVVAIWGVAGAFGGAVLANIAILLLGLASDTVKLRMTLLSLGLLAAAAVGLISGTAVLNG